MSHYQVSLTSPLITKVYCYVISYLSLSLATPKHLNEGVNVIKSFKRVQGNLSLMINDLDKNLEFITKLRVTTYYLLVLIYYLAVMVHMVHLFYILTTYGNYFNCPCIKLINMSSPLSSLLSSFFSSLLSFYSYLLFFSIHLLIRFDVL